MDKTSFDVSWDQFVYVVLDLEGTGPQHKDREGIVDIAAVTVEKGKVTDNVFQRLLNPEIEIPIFVSRIHGIYNKDVIDRPLFNDVKHELEAYLTDKILVAHNARVEQRVLNQKLPSYCPPVILDTFKLFKNLYPQATKHGLDNLIDQFNLTSVLSTSCPTWKRHSACYDAIATAHAFVLMISNNLKRHCTLNDLVKLCAIKEFGSEDKRDAGPYPDSQRSFFDETDL